MDARIPLGFPDGTMMAVCQDPHPPQDIPRGMEMAKKFGLEFPPPPGS